MRFKKDCLLLAVIFITAFSGCKKWEDHTALNNQDLTKDLYTAIKEEPTLSRFAELITQAGLDSLLKSSKSFTVWAPSNSALNSLDPAIPADTAKLRKFVLNHISYELYFTRDAQITKRIGMLNGKYNNFLTNKFEDATITSADKYVKNGVLHTIDKYIAVLPNLWEYINSTAVQYTQNNFIAGLNFTSFDPSLAVVDSISSSTGLPVYHPGTGIVIKNNFNERVFDTRKEDKQYTYFIIANPGFISKADSLKPYFKSTSVAITDSLDKWNIVKDVLVDVLYPTVASLPPVLTSKFGTPIPIDASAITGSTKVSNGIVYVLSGSGVTTASKFRLSVIQGETPSGFQSDKTANTNYRVRYNPVSSQNYSDILVSGHGVTGYYSFYRLDEMPSMKYNVYAFAVNDFQSTNIVQSINPFYFTAPATFTAQPCVSTQLPANTTQLSYAVPLKSAVGAYNEVFLGSFTSNLYGTLELRLTSGNTTNPPVLGGSGNGPIVLDYLRIVPIP
jgi:uncharacterized surface protein with fasciclin (FAS1) repeats